VPTSYTAAAAVAVAVAEEAGPYIQLYRKLLCPCIHGLYALNTTRQPEMSTSFLGEASFERVEGEIVRPWAAAAAAKEEEAGLRDDTKRLPATSSRTFQTLA
jgi:hypothetical protein